MDHAVRLHAIHQFHGAVMANLQALGQIADRRAKALSGESLYGQQQLMLPRFQPDGPRSALAEMQKLADLVAELREHPQLPQRYVFGLISGNVQEHPWAADQSIEFIDYNAMRPDRQVHAQFRTRMHNNQKKAQNNPKKGGERRGKPGHGSKTPIPGPRPPAPTRGARLLS